MLSCHDLAHKYASDYIDGQLNWRQRLAVFMHLLICVRCRRFVTQLRLVCRVVKQRGRDVIKGSTPDLDALASRLHKEYATQKKSSSEL
ncbi:zf-HC2 domain-containing protein [Aestuariicella sp. G3-2]|uniref:zf-HC2 domain-containing protein n=1 Tax=Pseudomaricurvus albidus TaxID=2842452 RepID=UPI001C0AEB75|nr:zf-HC2 domain-containing protein [Aestuariicella albida]MBU3071310.1 zf-HC2 domain-containing protein [Aestuariicella albida]